MNPASEATPRVLILGGTGEARELARLLTEKQIRVITSLAGRVADPRLPVGEVRSGGFGGAEGLREWLVSNGIDAVIDATHPFAARITSNADAACRAAGTPLLRLLRPPWRPEPGDRWESVPDLDAAAALLGGADRRILLTTGRQDVARFAGVADAWFLIRVVDPPTGALPARHEILRSRGPYHLAAERELLAANDIDTLVTKNSGGEMTRPKLDAAHELGIRVIVVERPQEPAATPTVDDPVAAAAWVSELAQLGR